MIPYWLFFALVASIAIGAKTSSRGPFKSNDRRDSPLGWMAMFVVLTMFVGLRHEVGGDWGTYERHYFEMESADFDEALQHADPAYYVVNWLSAQLGGGIYLVNLICAAAFSWGLIALCRVLPQPWLALTVATPYLITVVAMGYTRQGVAVGFAMLGMAAFSRGRVVRYLVWVAVAATFHKSAVLLFPIAALAAPRNKLLTIVATAVVSGALYVWLLQDSVETLSQSYLDAEYSSEGALVRIMMNVVPAIVILLLFRRMTIQPAERNLWLVLSAMSLLALLALAVSSSSTAVDRVALYMIPIQLAGWASLPQLLDSGRSSHFWTLAVVAYSLTVLFVWLNFAAHANLWLPYQSWLFL